MITCDGAAANSSVYKQGMLVWPAPLCSPPPALQPRLCSATSEYMAAAALYGSVRMEVDRLWVWFAKDGVSISWQYASCQKLSYWLAWCGLDTVWQPVALDFLPAHWVVFQCNQPLNVVWHATASCNSPSLHNFVMEMNWTHLLFRNCHKEAPPHPVTCPWFCFLPGQLCCVCAFVPLLTTLGH